MSKEEETLVSLMEAAPIVSCPGQYVLGRRPTENSLGPLERAQGLLRSLL